MADLDNKLKKIEEAEPDHLDLSMIEESIETDFEDSISLTEFQQSLASHTGKLSVRLPRSLHKKLKEQAKFEGVSLNQYVLYKLAK
jgi:predicted HicB family RNase H-like nuclease